MFKKISSLSDTLKISKWARVVEQKINPENPLFVLCHEISGEALKINRPTSEFIHTLSSHAHFKKSQLLRAVDKNSLKPILEMAKRHIILDGSCVNEFSLFSDYVPQKTTGFLSYEGKNGSRIFLGHPKCRQKNQMIELKGWEVDFLNLCDQGKTLAEISAKLGVALDRIEVLFSTKLALREFQAVKLVKSNNEHLRFFIEDWRHPDAVSESKKKSFKDNLVVDLDEFHKTGITDAFEEFDEIETTLSHAFRHKSAALGGQSYGGRFFHELQRCGYLNKGASVLEVGGGTGVFSREFLAAAREKFKNQGPLSYTILDLSPELQKSQKQQHTGSDTKFLLGNAESFKIPKNSLDLVLSNEVIADFKTVKLVKKSKNSGQNKYQKMAWTLIKKYKIDISSAPQEFYFNLGALLFLEKVFHSLKVGGSAVITEFGGVNAYPVATYHLNHNEYSIHWGHLIKAAEFFGFQKIELMDLSSFIPFNHHEFLLEGGVEGINRILQNFGKPVIPSGAYTQTELELLLAPHKEIKFHGLRYAPFYMDLYWGPSHQDFKALIIRK